MSRQLWPESVSQFQRIAEVSGVSENVLDRMRTLDEKTELEPRLMAIVGEVDETPHGPSEIADQLTVHLDVLGKPRFTAIVTKGKATQQVRARDVTYQLTRAARVPELDFVILGAVGDIQDDVKADLGLIAQTGKDWMILDRRDLARLFIAYGQMCPHDGSWLEDRTCPACGYQSPPPVLAAEARYAILSLKDVSMAGAKRYSANVWVQPGLPQRELVAVVRRIVDQVRAETYARNELVQKTHGGRLADVVWLFVYEDPADQPFANWICRALWISPDLSEQWRPHGFGQPTAEDQNLSVDLRGPDTAVRDLLDRRRIDKGTYLRSLDAFLAAIPEVVATARALIPSSGPLSDAAEREMESLGDRVSELPRPDEQLVPPYELSDVDDAYGVVDAVLGNVFLPFTSRGRETWDQARRGDLARMAVDDVEEDLPKLIAERRRIK